jgi:hypothetical protein
MAADCPNGGIASKEIDGATDPTWASAGARGRAESGPAPPGISWLDSTISHHPVCGHGLQCIRTCYIGNVSFLVSQSSIPMPASGRQAPAAPPRASSGYSRPLAAGRERRLSGKQDHCCKPSESRTSAFIVLRFGVQMSQGQGAQLQAESARLDASEAWHPSIGRSQCPDWRFKLSPS